MNTMNSLRKLFWFALVLVVVFTTSCEKFLDVDGYFDDTLKYDSIFTSRNNLERYLWGAAGELPDESAIFGNDVIPGETATDEIFTLMTEGLFHGKALTLGLVSPSNLRSMNTWTPCYKVIRKCNVIINRIGECKDLSSLQRAELLGYVHFLRGYSYWMILQVHGPAVLLGDDVMDNNQDAAYYDRARATYDETVEYICAELEEAAKYIPEDVPILNFGRPTRGAAYGLIARVRLQAASPAYNGGAAARRYFGTWTRSTDGVNYVSQTYDENKWALAAAACQRVMDMKRYSLHTFPRVTETGDVTEKTEALPATVSDLDFPYGAGNIDAYRSYCNMFNGTTYPVQNKELVWGKTSGSIQGFTQQSFPIFMGGYNGMCIPQKAIDEFRLKNGETIEEGRADGTYSETGVLRAQQVYSGYRLLRGTNNMYVNREWRFYACVGFNGCYWPATSCSNNNFSQQTIYYYNGANAGSDKAISEPRNRCITGYVLKKYIHPEDNWYNGDGSTRTSKTFAIIRYAEILLSYAEAVNHLTTSHTVTLPSGESYTLSRAANLADAQFAINQVRFRVAQPAVSDAEIATEESFDACIRHERFIEFFCEGRRYHDVRRWGILEEVESEPITGMNVEADAANYYVRTIVNHSDYRNRVCDKKMVLIPLERNEVRKSKSLDQNPGW